MKRVKRIFLVIILITSPFLLSGQTIGIKSNILYDATTSMNLGLEWAFKPNWSIDVSATYNPWKFKDNRKMNFWLMQPEIRYWFCNTFNRHFVGVHTHYAQYNVAGMLPWGFTNGKLLGFIPNSNIMSHRYQGWLGGLGLSYGYQWILNNRFSLEASIGVGYAYLNYSKYPCYKCGKKIKEGHKNYIGPTKAAISLIYLIK